MNIGFLGNFEGSGRVGGSIVCTIRKATPTRQPAGHENIGLIFFSYVTFEEENGFCTLFGGDSD